MVLKRASNDLPWTFFLLCVLPYTFTRLVRSRRHEWVADMHTIIIIIIIIRCCFVFGPKYHAVLCGKYNCIFLLLLYSHFVMHHSHMCAVKRLLRVDLYNWGVQFCLNNFNVFESVFWQFVAFFFLSFIAFSLVVVFHAILPGLVVFFLPFLIPNQYYVWILIIISLKNNRWKEINSIFFYSVS